MLRNKNGLQLHQMAVPLQLGMQINNSGKAVRQLRLSGHPSLESRKVVLVPYNTIVPFCPPCICPIWGDGQAQGPLQVFPASAILFAFEKGACA